MSTDPNAIIARLRGLQAGEAGIAMFRTQQNSPDLLWSGLRAQRSVLRTIGLFEAD